ncbi:MAG: hypothetical protein ABI693_30630 [Bryobacteraceae bacterium]
MPLLGKKAPQTDDEAVRKLISEIDELDALPNRVFRRIWLLFLLVIPFALILFYFAAVRR